MEEHKQIETQNTQRKAYLQFSLTMIMLLVTGVACFLGGHLHGYRQGYHQAFDFWDSGQLRTYSFYVFDLLPKPDDGTKLTSQIELLVKQIKNDVKPGVWDETGGKASIDIDSSGLILRISANPIVIEEVDAYLKNKIRNFVVSATNR